MTTPDSLARAISLDTPQSWYRRWNAASAAYDPNWLEGFDWDAIFAAYGLDDRFIARFWQEMEDLRRDADLNFLCYLIHDLLFLAPWEDHYDIWSWSTAPTVYQHRGSPMINAVALLAGYPIHMENLAKRPWTEEQRQWSLASLGRTCLSERDKFGVDGVRFSHMIWAALYTKGTLFRTERLQYELSYRAYPAVEPLFEIPPAFVEIHIPGGGKLTAESVDRSLAEARAILPRLYPETAGRPLVFCVSSWLLSPELPELLPSESNILAFRDRFQILDQWPAEKDFFNFLYGLAKPVPYDTLPEDTHLRRSVKQMLLQGRTLHSAQGVLRACLPK